VTPFWELALRAVDARHDVQLEREARVFSTSLVRNLIAANEEKQGVIDFQAREILRLRDLVTAAHIDNALMVEAVARNCRNYVEASVRMH
jgi:hypothetical protein